MLPVVSHEGRKCPSQFAPPSSSLRIAIVPVARMLLNVAPGHLKVCRLLRLLTLCVVEERGERELVPPCRNYLDKSARYPPWSQKIGCSHPNHLMFRTIPHPPIPNMPVKVPISRQRIA